MISETTNSSKTRGQQNKAGPVNMRSAIDNFSLQAPSIELPKGGGAIKGIEEKFQVNAVTGTSSFGIPIPLSPSRHGFVPPLGLNYNSGSGNSPFGLGWQLGIPSIARKTEKNYQNTRMKRSQTLLFYQVQRIWFHF